MESCLQLGAVGESLSLRWVCHRAALDHGMWGAAMTEPCHDMDPKEDSFPPLLTPLFSLWPIQVLQVMPLTLADQREKFLLEREEGKGLSQEVGKRRC